MTKVLIVNIKNVFKNVFKDVIKMYLKLKKSFWKIDLVDLSLLKIPTTKRFKHIQNDLKLYLKLFHIFFGKPIERYLWYAT